ncbi:MAG TPA: hypothetical protein VIU37_06665 [Candidatus Limnocylindrales bacterium]
MPWFFPILLVAHVTLALTLVLPSILLPFALRARRATVESGSGVVQTLLWAQSNGSAVIGIGLAITGIGLVLSLGTGLLRQGWLLLALAIYAVTLGIALFIQRPNLRALIGIRAGADDDRWRARAQRQRYVSYLMAGLVGTIGFLMSSKPVLW